MRKNLSGTSFKPALLLQLCLIDLHSVVELACSSPPPASVRSAASNFRLAPLTGSPRDCTSDVTHHAQEFERQITTRFHKKVVCTEVGSALVVINPFSISSPSSLLARPHDPPLATGGGLDDEGLIDQFSALFSALEHRIRYFTDGAVVCWPVVNYYMLVDSIKGYLTLLRLKFMLSAYDCTCIYMIVYFVFSYLCGREREEIERGDREKTDILTDRHISVYLFIYIYIYI